MLNKVYEKQYLRSQGLDSWSKKRKREENLKWMKEWMEQEKKTRQWILSKNNIQHEYRNKRFSFEERERVAKRKGDAKALQKIKEEEEKLGTEEEFLERELDGKYHVAIPLRMVKIIMDLLEKDENILINK